MNIGEIQQDLLTTLLSMYSEGEAAVICDWVMEHYTGRSKMQRSLDKRHVPAGDIVNAIGLAKTQLCQHRPVQYVLGEAWFMGLKFFVNESVLIPRPETEELVAWLVASYRAPDSSCGAPDILDIGTGSGCIPVAVKKQMPGARVSAVDICHKALQTALQNATANHVSVDFRHVDFLNETLWKSLATFDCIISNPPYIPLAEKATLDQQVAAWEPGTALFVPDGDALLFYKKIAAFGKTHLNTAGKIFVEMHQDHAIATQQMFSANGYVTQLKKDINDNNRMLMAWME